MKQKELQSLQRLSDGVGQFIRYWGFRKIHGEIWAVVYLSTRPLAGVEIGKILKVSKALVSPALKELESEGLILQTKSENSKTKRYIAVDDVTSIIQGVLKRREIPMIKKIEQHHSELRRESTDGKMIHLERLENMGMMIKMAQIGLGSLLESD